MQKIVQSESDLFQACVIYSVISLSSLFETLVVSLSHIIRRAVSYLTYERLYTKGYGKKKLKEEENPIGPSNW